MCENFGFPTKIRKYIVPVLDKRIPVGGAHNGDPYWLAPYTYNLKGINEILLIQAEKRVGQSKKIWMAERRPKRHISSSELRGYIVAFFHNRMVGDDKIVGLGQVGNNHWLLGEGTRRYQSRTSRPDASALACQPKGSLGVVVHSSSSRAAGIIITIILSLSLLQQ